MHSYKVTLCPSIGAQIDFMFEALPRVSMGEGNCSQIEGEIYTGLISFQGLRRKGEHTD